ncbi:MAG: hypothetical protein ACI4U9_02370 [Clostridia bacterium]
MNITSGWHDYVNGKCTRCGAKSSSGGGSGGGSGSDGTTECEHTYVTKNDETNHWEECSKCNEEKTDSKEAHKGATHANGGKCTVCNYQYQKHEPSETLIEYTTTENAHTPVYKCSFEGCTENCNGTEENHEFGQYTDNEDGTHSATCSICEYKLTAEHNYENGKCSECNAEKPSEEEPCIHNYTIKKDKTNHWEECTKCGEEKAGSKEAHTYGTYTDNEDGTHSATCSICNYKLTAEHNYENGKCSECNAEKPNEDETCVHNYTIKKDKMKHWEECTKCGEVKTGTLGAHTFTNYVDNGDGTHSATCTKCGYKLTEEHKAGEKCPDCGNSEQKPEEDNNNDNQNGNNNQNNSNNQNNNNQNNNGDKTDNTVVDKDIPYAGIKSIGFIAIFALGAVGVISAVKMKRYKGV